MENLAINKRIYGAMKAVLVIVLLGFGSNAHPVFAQGMVNVTVTGIPSVINTPFVDVFEQNFRNGRYQVIFTYNNTNTQPVDFRFQFRVTRNGEEVVSVLSNPKSYRPGAYVFTSVFDELTFPQTLDDILDDLGRDVKNQIVQAGAAPEGNYVLYIKAIPQNGPGIISSPPSINPFSVIYPDAPILINPSANSNVTLQTPVFNWLNVAISGFSIEYDFLLVEVLENQTALQAINSNRAIAERTLMGQNTLVYTPEFLPLEAGQEYAWRVTAHSTDGTLPIKNEGESIIQTFTYQQGSLAEGLGGLEDLDLVPGFARLTNLENLTIDERPTSYVLNGPAAMELDFGQAYDVPVDVRGLTIQKGSPDNPNIMAGIVEAQGNIGDIPVLNEASHIVDFNRLRWALNKGVQAAGKLKLPDGTLTEAQGWLQLASMGLSGKLRADNPTGILKAGEDPVELYIEKFEATFPAMQLFAQGRVELFGGTSVCKLTQINVLEKDAQAVFNCPDDASISLVEDSAQLQLLLDNWGGTIDYDFDTDDFSYDLAAQGTVKAGLDSTNQCSVFMQAGLTDGQGFSVSQIVPTCSVYAPPLDLGFMKLKLSGINLKELNYVSDGDWDFDLNLEGALTIPAMDGWSLPLSTIDVTSGGLHFPELNWDAGDLGMGQPLTINGFGIKPISFSMSNFTFPWFDWSQQDIDLGNTGDWNFNFDFDFDFPDGFGDSADDDDSTGSILPACLTTRVIPGLSGSFEKGAFSANIPATVLKDCSIKLADDYTFIIDQLGGRLTAAASASQMNLDSQVKLDARFMAGTPFNCGKEKPAPVGKTSLKMNSVGLLDGKIDDIVDKCEAKLGPFTADITQSDLLFSSSGGKQKLVIDAEGVLALNEAQSVTGTLKYDVLNGKFDELDFSYEDPFVLKLPSEKEPLLSFLVKGLRLTKDGLLINGRQEFIIGDREEVSHTLQEFNPGVSIGLSDGMSQITKHENPVPVFDNTIGVTFDNTLISLSEFNIVSGRIIFDKAFALKASLDPGETNIAFQVLSGRKKRGNLSSNSAYMGLGERIVIDKNGLHAKGKARAGIQISDLKFDSLEVRFSKDFAMGLRPFGVDQGQADFSNASRRIAYINSTGFHLDPTYLTQAIPDTLPLPSKETAYMVLRNRNDSLLVQAVKKSDGTYTMSTTAPVDLVIPAIQGTDPVAPKVGVSFTNITYDPASGEITAGSIQGDFNPAIDLNKIGVPFKLRNIRYDDGIAINDEQFGGDRGLFLQGDILLYQQQIGDMGSASLFLENGDHLRGDVDLDNVNADIPLVPSSNLAVLQVDSLKGSVNVALTESVPPDVSLDMWGQFRLQNQSDKPIAALNYFATYDDGNFGINAKNQPQNKPASNTAFIGPAGFRIDKINTLNLSYTTESNDFDFRSKLDFSLLMDISDGDTLEVPLHSVEITENGFSIPQQTINSSSTPALNASAFTMGPVDLKLLELRTLSKISFNWFDGEGVPPAFKMDFNLNLSGLSDDAPQASAASVTLENVGFNKGIITGSLRDYTPVGGSLPIALGGSTSFNLTKISGGLINDGTTDHPVQGYDIKLAGNLAYPDFFGDPQPGCTHPTLNVNLSKAGGLVGVVHNVAPCGKMTYGPATITFDPSDSLAFAFKDDTQSVILGGSVHAEIEQQDAPNITATGSIQADVLNGEFIDGEILVNDLFTYNYPQTDPFFKFRVQHARLNQNGVVFTGDAGLAFPGSEDTARVTFRNFAIHPQNEQIASGEFTIQDSVGVEVGINPINWKMVDPASEFTRENAGRLVVAGGITVNTTGMTLDANSTAAIHAAGEIKSELEVSYQNFKIGFSPLSVTSGRADFKISGESSSFAYLDKDQFHVNLTGAITSVLPDTLNLPTRETAFLVLGDKDSGRYEYDDSQTPGRIYTLPGKVVSLVIPGLNNEGDTLKVDVTFDARIDNMLHISSGVVALDSPVDLSPYLNIPLQLDSLNYNSRRGLKASASVILPQSLNNVKLMASAGVGPNGFEQGSITAGEYTESYLPSQESVTPIAADTLGSGALAFYIRGLEIEFGQTNSLAFSGQLKSDLLEDDEGHQTPIQYAASYGSDRWNVSIDNGNLTDGIDLGFAQIEPIPQSGHLFSVTMDQNEFAVSFAGVIRMQELLGDGFSLELKKLKLSTKANSQGEYITVQAKQDLPDQNFELINGVLDFKSTNTSVSLVDKVLAIKTGGTFNFYNKTDLDFEDLEFKSDGSVSLGGLSSGNLLTDRIELLPDSSLVLKDLSLGVEGNALKMTAEGFATLPKPLDEQRAAITISGDTDGKIYVTGPDFTFDTGFTVGNNPETEYEIGSFATLELTGLGLDIDLKNFDQTALYAAGAIYIENNTNKRIMFGDAGDLEAKPGIKYSISDGIEWNVDSNFDPDTSPLSFKYEFFDISVTTIQVNTDVTVDGETLPFQAEIGGRSGLNIAGVGGDVGFAGFKFSTSGVNEIGHFDGGGTFTLMDIVSLELGTFEYKTAEDNGGPFTLEFKKGSGTADTADVSTDVITDVTKYLHFASNSEGKAINLSLSEGISGGVEEVIYYQTDGGNRYFKIKNANLQLSDQASITAGMEFLSTSSGYSLSVAGGGKFGSVGIAAAGNISTINNNLRFGIFVAASAPVNFLGIVEVSSFGGGFYYRPTTDNLDATIDVIKGFSGGGFKLNGPQPDVSNLKFAALVYGELTLGGTSGASAITANALIQVTDQFTKIDANGYVLGQKNSFKAGMYVTILYTPEVAGLEGGVTMDIKYDPVLVGSSQVDFFAKKDRTKPGSDVLWGIDGNFSLSVLSMLDVEGTILLSANGLLLELKAGKHFDIAVVSAHASFELIVWYLPKYTDPLGMYAKARIGFDICHGLAAFDATIEAGFFKRESYSMLYFAGSVHVTVLWVIDGNVSGWVKVQTKSPTLDYGRGSNAEMEQLISDAKDKAGETKDKAEETKDNLEDAKDDLESSIADAGQVTRSDEDLAKAGLKIFTDPSFDDVLLANVRSAERDLWGRYDHPVLINIAYKMMQGGWAWYSGFDSFSRPLPPIKDGAVAKSVVDDAKSQVTQNVQPVKDRIDAAISELDDISESMKAALDNEAALNIQNPIIETQEAIITPGGSIQSSPGFSINESTIEDNASSLNSFESDRLAKEQRYRDAIKAAAASISLVDLVASGEASIDWGSDAIDVNIPEDTQSSINNIAYQYMNAVQQVRKYNAELIGSYWDRGEWASNMHNLMESHQSDIQSYAERTSWRGNSYKVEKAAEIAYKMASILDNLIGTSNASNVRQAVSLDNSGSESAYEQTVMDFWYRMPTLGLNALSESSRQKAEALAQSFEQKLQEIENGHKTFTQSVDELYTLKTEMLTSLYGLIEEFNGWARGSSNQEITDAPYSNKKYKIEQELAPPSIDRLSGINTISASNFNQYYGIATMSYSASHPQGVPEISFNILNGTVTSIYQVNDYYTGGIRNERGYISNRYFRARIPKQNLHQTSRRLTGAIRARGSGGTTISRLVNFTIPVAPGGADVSATVQMGDDTTPPSTPIVSSQYKKYNNIYWTSDSTKLQFKLISVDHESDVRLYKYKIGTSLGGNQVRDWTDAQGTRGIWLDKIGMAAVIRGLNLQPGTDYYLSVKSVNGDNTESSVEKVSKPFRFDPTPPAKPEVSVVYSTTQRQKAPTQPVIQQAVTEKPAWDSQGGNMVLAGGQAGIVSTGGSYAGLVSAGLMVAPTGCTRQFDPKNSNQGQEVALSWSSEDPETDIQGFYLAKKNAGNLTSHDVFGDSDCAFYEADEIAEWNTSLSFKKPEYWYFQARNNVGMRGEMKIIGPINKEDATVPTTPNVKVRAAADGFYMYVTKLAKDDQTGIKGYQYALLDSAGTDTLRAWPDSATVDFELPENARSKSSPPVKFIPWGAFLDGGYYQVSVRAINGQNMASRAVTNTGVLYDNTPPEPTVFNVDYDTNGKINIQIDELGDAETGIALIRYELVSYLEHDLLIEHLPEQNGGNMEAIGQSTGISVMEPSNTLIRQKRTKRATVLTSGSIESFTPNMVLNIRIRNLEYLAPVSVRIIARNGVGSERINEKSIKIPAELMKKVIKERSKEKQEKQKQEKQEKMMRINKTKLRGRGF